MRAWIEVNNDESYFISIEEYDGGILERSVSWIHRPLQWTVEIEDE